MKETLYIILFSVLYGVLMFLTYTFMFSRWNLPLFLFLFPVIALQALQGLARIEIVIKYKILYTLIMAVLGTAVFSIFKMGSSMDAQLFRSVFKVSIIYSLVYGLLGVSVLILISKLILKKKD